MLHGTAATVVLLRDAPAGGVEVLLLERPRHQGSFAGAWVFPGGVVDPQDYGQPADDDELTAARQAGVRETAEETGLPLEPQHLVQLSCWVPPPEAPRRYKTWFFLAEAPAGRIRLSPREHVAAAWLTPAEAFRRQRQGTMELVPPTWVTLHGLLDAGNVAEVLAGAAAAVPETYTTRRLPGQVPPVMVWQGDADYPGQPGQPDRPAEPHSATPGADVPARRHRLVMDRTDWSYQRNT